MVTVQSLTHLAFVLNEASALISAVVIVNIIQFVLKFITHRLQGKYDDYEINAQIFAVKLCRNSSY